MLNDLLCLQIETTASCNARCKFCPHEKLELKGLMEESLFDKIIDEASQISSLSQVYPFLTGEPLTDVSFLDRLRKLRDKMPTVGIDIYTNGSLLTESVIESLKEIGGLRISISLNGMSPETRKTITGLDDYWQVIQSMKSLERHGMGYRATMVCYPDISREEVSSFIQSGGMAIQYQSWAGKQYPYERKRWTQCARALNYLTVRYNGDVVLCCFDPAGDVCFGNLREETIEKIWTGEAHQKYQEMHKLGRGNELAKCRNCTEG